MDDLQHFHELADLEERVRLIERVSSEATQLVVTSGDERYIVGDLTQREGTYRLSMNEHTYSGRKKVPNPHQGFAGEYDSFEDIEESIEAAKGLWLLGNKLIGITIGVVAYNAGRAGGPQFANVGKIVHPLLKPDEEIRIVHVDERGIFRNNCYLNSREIERYSKLRSRKSQKSPPSHST